MKAVQMDIQEIKDRAKSLAQNEPSQDTETCLYRDVLRAISCGIDDPKGFADAALLAES